MVRQPSASFEPAIPVLASAQLHVPLHDAAGGPEEGQETVAEPEEQEEAEVLAGNPLPRQLSVWEAPGYRITFHTSAKPMAGTSSQVGYQARRNPGSVPETAVCCAAGLRLYLVAAFQQKRPDHAQRAASCCIHSATWQ